MYVLGYDIWLLLWGKCEWDEKRKKRKWKESDKEDSSSGRLSGILEKLKHPAAAGSKLWIPTHKDHFITSFLSVLHTGSNVQMKRDCTHEEADSRIMVHSMNVIQHGTTSVKIQTGDTAVVVIVCSQYYRIDDRVTIWIEFLDGGIVAWKALKMFVILWGQWQEL